MAARQAPPRRRFPRSSDSDSSCFALTSGSAGDSAAAQLNGLVRGTIKCLRAIAHGRGRSRCLPCCFGCGVWPDGFVCVAASYFVDARRVTCRISFDGPRSPTYVTTAVWTVMCLVPSGTRYICTGANRHYRWGGRSKTNTQAYSEHLDEGQFLIYSD